MSPADGIEITMGGRGCADVERGATTTITITLPEDLAKRAKDKGLLSSTALAQIIGEAIQSSESVAPENPPTYPPDLDPRLRGAVNPLAFKWGKVVGDVVCPLGITFEGAPDGKAMM